MGARALTVLVFVFLSLPVDAQFASDHQRREALQHYREGERLMSSEQFEQATGAFQRAIEADRLLTLAHYRQGQAYMALRRFASAIKAFADCREVFRTLHTLAEGHRLGVERQLEDELRAMRETTRRMAADGRRPRDTQLLQLEGWIRHVERQRPSLDTPFQVPAEVSLALGSAYFRNEQLEDAEREWRAAVAVNARFGEAHNNLAALYAMTGRKKDAADAVHAAERAGFRVHPQLKDDIRTMEDGRISLRDPEYRSAPAGGGR